MLSLIFGAGPEEEVFFLVLFCDVCFKAVRLAVRNPMEKMKSSLVVLSSPVC